MTNPDTERFIRLRLQTAYEWFEAEGRQVLASDMNQCFAALDSLVEEHRLALVDARRPITPMEGDAV